MHICAEMWTLVHTTVQKSIKYSAPTYVLVYKEIHMQVHSTSEFMDVCTLEWLKKERHDDIFQHIFHVFPKSLKKEEGKL